jgi:hypothetical protein
MNDKSFDPWNGNTIRYTIHKAEIGQFLEDLQMMQNEMIELAVEIEEKKGFPRVKELLDSLAK